MIGIAGLFGVIVGAIVAYASDRHPSHVEALETVAGLLVLAGFVAASYALSAMIIV